MSSAIRHATTVARQYSRWIGTWDDPELQESCTPPPPALPDAGEQPTDPTAAEAEVRAAMSTLYGFGGSGEVGTELLDDPTGVAEAREQVRAGGFAEMEEQCLDERYLTPGTTVLD